MVGTCWNIPTTLLVSMVMTGGLWHYYTRMIDLWRSHDCEMYESCMTNSMVIEITFDGEMYDKW